MLIVRADWILRKMVKKLRRFALVLRDEVTDNIIDEEHDDEGLMFEEFGINECEGCKNAVYENS